MGELEEWCIKFEITGERLLRARYIDTNGSISMLISKDDRNILSDLLKELRRPNHEELFNRVNDDIHLYYRTHNEIPGRHNGEA